MQPAISLPAGQLGHVHVVADEVHVCDQGFLQSQLQEALWDVMYDYGFMSISQDMFEEAVRRIKKAPTAAAAIGALDVATHSFLNSKVRIPRHLQTGDLIAICSGTAIASMPVAAL